MSKKSISLKLVFALSNSGKPAVSFIGIDYGVPFTSHIHTPGTSEGDAFAEFSKAAHKFCQQLKDAGELR